jgi:hypothetical protein
VGPEVLRKYAVEADSLLGGSRTETLTSRLIDLREPLSPLEQWSDVLLDLLILRPDLLEASRNYMDAWLELARFVLDSENVAKLRTVAENLVLLDADWLYSDSSGSVSYVSARLFPNHPFVLAPAVALAEYARLNVADLSTQRHAREAARDE